MFKFTLPDIGEGVTEGEIIKWIVKEGDVVKKEQDMVEIMTDKVNINIPSPVEGKVNRILFKEGQVVKVGEVIIEIDDGSKGDEKKSESPAEVKDEPQQKMSVAETVKEEGGEKKLMNDDQNRRILASPTIRRIAKDRGIDLDNITPTGPNGRVTLEDLDNAEREMKQKTEAPKSSGIRMAPVPPATARQVEQPKAPEAQSQKMQEPTPVKDEPKVGSSPQGKEPEPVVHVEETASTSEDDQVFEPHGLRRLIFEKMSKSKQIMPHFMVAETVDISKLTKTMNDMREKGTKVTLTPFFVKAVAVALTEFPKFNAHYDESNKRYIFRKSINMGVAIDTPSGLTVAVVKNAIDKSVVQISSEISDLAKKARENKLTLTDVQDSTFTISNVGSIGGLISTPIINYPEVAILAVHRSTKKGTNFESGDDSTIISLSCDHRLIDGADAARFIVKVKSYLEDPISFLIR